MYGTDENKDAVVMLLCAVMSGQLGHGKRRYGQWLEPCAACSCFGWMDGQMKKVVNERASGLSLFSTCLLLGKLGASEKVIVIGVVATWEIPEWEAFRGKHNIYAKLR